MSRRSEKQETTAETGVAREHSSCAGAADAASGAGAVLPGMGDCTGSTGEGTGGTQRVDAGSIYVDVNDCNFLNVCIETALTIPAGKGYVRIFGSGRVEVTDCKLDDAALAFWSAVEKAGLIRHSTP